MPSYIRREFIMKGAATSAALWAATHATLAAASGA
jgi:hypothetical protein